VCVCVLVSSSCNTVRSNMTSNNSSVAMRPPKVILKPLSACTELPLLQRRTSKGKSDTFSNPVNVLPSDVSSRRLSPLGSRYVAVRNIVILMIGE